MLKSDIVCRSYDNVYRGLILFLDTVYVCLCVCVCVKPIGISGHEPVYARVQKPDQYGDVHLDAAASGTDYRLSNDVDSWV